jgi:hypothetical protein
MVAARVFVQVVHQRLEPKHGPNQLQKATTSTYVLYLAPAARKETSPLLRGRWFSLPC